MANNEDKLSRLYREGLENFAKDPPPQVWAGIKQGLLIKNLVTLRFLTSLNIYSVTVFVAAAAIAGFFAGNQLQQKNKVADTNKTASIVVTQIPSNTNEIQEIKTRQSTDQLNMIQKPINITGNQIKYQSSDKVNARKENYNKSQTAQIPKKAVDTTTPNEDIQEPVGIGDKKPGANDLNKNAEPDTKPIATDRQKIQNEAVVENTPSGPDPKEKTTESSKPPNLTKKPKTGQGFYAEIFGAPSFVTYKFEQSAVNPNLIFVKTSKEDEKSALSYTAGLELGYGLRNIFAQTGINYSDYRSKSLVDLLETKEIWTSEITRDSTFWYTDSNLKDHFKYTVDTIRNLIANDTTITHSSTNSMRYIEIPILIGYRFYGKRISYALLGGISFGYLTASGGQALNPDLKSLSANSPNAIPYRQWTQNLILRTELAYLVKQNLSVFIRPGFKYNLNSVFEDNYPVQKSYYALDLHLGLRYNF